MRSSRLPSFALVALCASGCADTGAHLTFSAPAGPRTASSFRVVLATPEIVPSVGSQRIALGDNATQTVSYYLQRTIAGASEDTVDKVDGFTVRIAPDGDFADTQFIPFVLMYDAQAQIVGIGTYRAGDTAAPSSILVMRDEIDKYTLDVEAVTQVDEKAAPAPGQVRVIECEGQGDPATFTSGIVWNPQGGGELRIVFPDDGGTDATGRALDLDCDGHAVAPDNSRPDCDDTRDWFHRDAEDVCDGYDTNCDGFQAIATACMPTTNTCIAPGTNMPAPGLELCDDRTGESLGCHASASCQCETGAGCITCSMPYMVGQADGLVRPCQPSIGLMSTYGKCSAQAPCDVELLGATNGWKLELGPSSAGPFGTRATGVGDVLLLKAKHPDDSTFEQDVGTGRNLSDVSFAFITAAATEYVTMRIQIGEDPAVASCPVSPMLTCAP
jgi:hypothetical protein